MTPSYRGPVLGLLAAFCTALTACSDDATGPSEPGIVSATIEPSSDAPHTSIRVVLDAPGPVRVRYWRDADADALEVTSATEKPEHEIFLPRTYAASGYRYDVRVLDAGGTPGDSASGTFTTGALPEMISALQFTATGSPSDSLALIEVMITENGFGGGAVIVDEEGRIVWYWQGQGGLLMGSTRRANGNFVFHDAGRLVELTPARDIVAELPNANAGTPYETIHHDVALSPQNTLYFIANESRPLGDSTLVGESIWEWVPEANQVTKRFSVFDFLSWPEDMGPESVLNNWMHMNSLAVGPRGNILYSARSLDQVVSIAPDFSEIEYRLGGPNATIPAEGDAFFSGQHNISEIAPNRILMWDNGRRRPPGEFSRGLELQVDPTAGTATKIREFQGDPQQLQAIVGGAFRLTNGRTLITYGFGGGDRINIFEVDDAGTIYWRLVAPQAIGRIYKARTIESIAGERRVPRPSP